MISTMKYDPTYELLVRTAAADSEKNIVRQKSEQSDGHCTDTAAIKLAMHANTKGEVHSCLDTFLAEIRVSYDSRRRFYNKLTNKPHHMVAERRSSA